MNNIFQEIFAMFVNCAFPVVLTMLCGCFLSRKYSKAKTLAFIIPASALMLLADYFIGNSIIVILDCALLWRAGLRAIAFSVISVLYCLFVFKNRISQKIGIPLLINLIFLISSVLFYLFAVFVIFSDPDDLFRKNPEYITIFDLSAYFTAGFLIYIFARKKSCKKIRKDIITHTVVFCISFIVIIFLFGTASNFFVEYWVRYYIEAIIFAIIIVNISVILLIEKIRKSHVLEIQNEVMQSEQEMYKAQIEQSNQYIREIAKIKHDMKNRVLCISELIESGNINEAEKLCDSLKNELEKTSYIFGTSNPYLNSILNVMYKKSKENDIDIKTVIKSSIENIDGTDLISLLGNLCDNAIEALQKIGYNRQLSISVTEKGGYYIFTVKNRIEQSVLKNNAGLHSSKSDNIYHGYGLKNVESIAKKYDGILDISEDEDMFIVSVMLRPQNKQQI